MSFNDRITIYRRLSLAEKTSAGSFYDDEKCMQTTCKQMLETEVFKGSYQERRHMEELGGYRDLIVVSETDKNFIDNLQYVKERILKFYPDKKLWIGISSKDMIGAPAAGTCIWSEITTDLPFGQYYFTVQTLQFRDREVILKVKNVAAERDAENKSENSLPKEENQTEIDMKKLLESWKKGIAREIYQFLYFDNAKENIIAFIKYMLVLAIFLWSNAIEFLKYFIPFSLHFMTEVREILIAITPTILKLLDLLRTIIGGLFVFTAMIYRDLRGLSSHSYKNYQIMDAPNNYRDKQRMYY